jgi:DNA (cytosine-5)-methyltransferase 1
MADLTIGSLFSGIGGLELGLEWAGLGPVLWQVEQDPFCRGVLARHWPAARRYDDVCTVAEELAPVDLICGGFPCQGISQQGNKLGLTDERSGLWSEYLRIVRLLRPRFVVVENVAALAYRGLGDVLGGLAACGYDAEWSVLSACAMGAPHTRERLFVVAHSPSIDGPRRMGDGAPWKGPVQRGDDRARSGSWVEAFAGVRGVADGAPTDVDRIRALGNSVVPQCAEVVGHVIRQLMEAAHG